MNNVQTNLAQMVRAKRSAIKSSQLDFADEIGISKNSLSAIETGQGNPQLSTLVSVADGLGISVSELFGGSSDEPLAELAATMLKAVTAFQRLDTERQSKAVYYFEQLLHLLASDANE